MREAAIRVARVTRMAAGVPRLRQGLEQWLCQADVTRHGLPRRAIVLVHRLRAGWAEVVHADKARRYAALGAALADAGRPALGTTSAAAVWFADEAELLACMARDATAGMLMAHWWWRLLLRDCAPAGARVAWQAAPRHVPRALHGLGPGLAERWLETWPLVARQALVTALAHAFAIGATVRVHVLSGPPAAAAAGRPFAQHICRLCDALLTDPQGVADGRCVDRWIRQDAAPLAAPADEGDLSRPQLATDPPGGTAWRPVASQSGGNRSWQNRASASSPARPASSADANADPAPVRAARGELRLVRPGASLRDSREELAEARGGAGSATDMARPAAVAQHSVPAGPLPVMMATTAPRVLDTAMGGVFFLLNAALQLDLYGDFTRPFHAGLDASPWYFLRQAARAMGAPVRADDALAGWLHRRGGARRRPAEQWRCPAQWLAPFAGIPGDWHAILDRGLLRLRHPAGFDVLREPVCADPDARIAAELERLGVTPRRVCCSVIRAAHPAANAPRDPWSLMWPVLRARLLRALDLPPRPARALPDTLLRLPARLVEEGERVELHFRLDALPLPVRLAGLDRDPGWIPAAGCDVRFYFHG
jgi:hypothetical protein